MSLKGLKWKAIICFVAAMAVLLGGGMGVKSRLPSYPAKVVGPDGALLFQKSDMMSGQNIYKPSQKRILVPDRGGGEI